MDCFGLFQQKFYLLSGKSRQLFSFVSEDGGLEKAVEDVFENMSKIEGGNVYSMFSYESSMLKDMMELSMRYKTDYPCIQQLPTYFKKLNEGDVFIRHKAWAPLCDLKRSIIKLRAVIEGREPHKDDVNFVCHWGWLFLHFDTYSYGFLTERITIGEKDKSKRVCRFCGLSGKHHFTKEAHAIMESLGNKLLFCNEECDDCNQAFEFEVERHLYKFLEINRTLYRVRGKESKKHHLEGRNFHIHPDLKTSQPIVYVMQEQSINDLYKGKVTGRLLLLNNGEISYYGVYKALVKIAVDLIPSDRKNRFVNTGRWVHGDIDSNHLPCFLYGEHNGFFEQPEVDLFFSNEKSSSCSPYCTAILYIYDAIFVYVVPLSNVDGNRFESPELLMAHWDVFKRHQYLNVSEWTEYDSNDKTLMVPLYKIPLLPKDNEYRIEFKPGTDEVFRINRN